MIFDVTPFDAGIFLGILLAMLLSEQPKRAGMAFCALVSLSIMGANALLDGWPLYIAIAQVELITFFGFFAVSRSSVVKSRMFFKIMALMFLVSSCNTWSLIHFRAIEGIYSAYVIAFHSIAVAHVALMLGFSDGLRDLGNSAWAWLNNRNRHHSGGFA